MRHMCNRQTRKNIALVLAFSMTAVTALTGCGKEEEVKDTSILVETVKPMTEDIELTGEFMGTVEADNTITVMAKASGDVTGTFFEVGDTVNAGDLLFTLDDRTQQIGMTTAQITADNAAIAVDNANASKSSAEYGLLYTQASIVETVGTMDTDEMRLLNAVNQTKLSLKTAQESAELAKESYGLAADNYDEMEDMIDELSDDYDTASKYYKSLVAIQGNALTISDKSSEAEAESYATGTLGIPASVFSGASTAMDVANAYIDYQTDGAADGLNKIDMLVKAANTSRNAISSSKSAVRDSKESLRISRFSAAIDKEIKNNSVLTAEDAKKLAEKALEDYRNFTKATILAGLDSKLAASNLSVIQATNSVATAENSLKSAQAGLETAQINLDNTKGIAPVSGVITAKNITTNNMANMGTPAYVIEAQDGISVTFFVAESVMKELSVGQRVVLERNDATYQGEISECYTIADASNGLFKVKITISSGAENLITGTKVKVRMATKHANNVMTLPTDSVYFESEKAYVYVKDGDKAVKTFIETGIANEKNVEIISGLSADTEVISTWASELKNGSLVKLKGEKAPDANAESETEVQEGKLTQVDTIDPETARDPHAHEVQELTLRTEVGLS